MKGQITFERTRAGIPVITERLEDSPSAGFMVAVNTGSRDESKDVWGISHLLEHVVFRATKTRSSFQMSKEIEGAGGEMNAFTAKEITAFYGVTIRDTADTAKSLVADIVCNPLINESDVDMEKKIVLQEISMVENDPSSYIHDLFAETMWKDHPLAHGEAGTTDIVKSLGSAELRKYYGERYVRPNVWVFACGNVDKDDVMSWAEENFDAMPDGKANERHAPKVVDGSYRHVVRKEDHCYVGMGFPSYGASDERRPALQMLNAVLGSGSSSRMFQEVREKRALVYSVYNYVDQNSDGGSMATYLSSTEENVLEAITTAGKVLRSIREEGVTKEELSKARTLVKGATIRRAESTEHELYRLCRGTMLRGIPLSLDDWLGAFDRVTCEDVMAVADDIIKNDLLSVTMYGNKVKSMKDFSPSQIEL